MIVGEAHIVVRAITDSVKKDIQNSFKDAGGIGAAAGAEAGERFADGFGRGMGGRGGGPLSNALSGMQSATEAARRQFDALITTSYTLGPAIAQLVAGISSLIGALGALAGMAAGAVPALGALGGAFSALLQGMGTLKLAFSGVSEAISAGQKAAVASSGATKAAEKDLTNYVRRVKDARRELTRTIEANADRIYEASMRIIDAENEIARTARDNAETVAESKLKVQQAQEKLNQAIKDGLEQIQQLGFDSEDAAINEKRAAFELDKARQTLLRTQDLPPNSNARRAAELAYAQADLNYRKAADTNKDMAAEKKRLDETGVDGTKGVIDAQNDLAKANYELAKDEREAEEDRIDGIKKIMGLYADQIKVQEENDRRLADAQRNLKRAENDLEKARKDSGAAGVAATNAYAAAMNKLSPEAQEFVRFMVDKFIPSIDKLKAAAGREFFPKLITAMTDIKDRLFPSLVPLLETTGGKLGDIAIKIGDAITSDKALGQIKRIWENNDVVIEHFGNVATSAIKIVLRLLEAVGPLTEKFAGWLDASAGKFEKFLTKDTKLKDLKDFFNQAGDIAAKFGSIFGSIFSGLGNIILDLMKPGSGGWQLLHFFDVMTQKFEDWTGSAEGSNKIAGYFKDVAQNAIAIMKATGPFVALFLKLGADPSVGQFADRMKDLAPTVESIARKFLEAGPALADFLHSAVEFIDLTTDSGAIQKFWDVLRGVADALVTLFSNPVVQKGFILFAQLAATLVALRTAWAVLKIPILAILNPLAAVGGWIIKLVAAFTTFQGPLGVVAFNLRMLVFAFGGLPIAAVTAAIGGLVLAFVAMWRESETFREALKDLVDNVINRAKKIFEELKAKVEEALEPFGGLEGVINGLKTAFKFLGDILGTYVVPVLGWLIEMLMELVGFILGNIITAIGKLWKFWKFVWDKIYAVVEFVVNWFKETAWPIIKKAIDLIADYYMFLWSIIKFVWDNIYNVVEKVVNWFRDTVWPIINTVIGLLVSGFNLVKDAVKVVWDFIYDKIETVALWFLSTAWPIIDKVFGFLKTGAGLVWDKIEDVFDFIKGKIKTVFENIRDIFWPILQTIFGAIKSGAGFVWDKIKESFDFISDKIHDVFKFIRDTVWPILSGVFSTLKSSAQGVWEKVRDVFNDIKTKVETVVGIVKGLLTNLWSGLSAGLGAAFGTVKTVLNALGRGVNKLIEGINFVAEHAPGDTPFVIPSLKEPLFAAKGGVINPRAGGTLAVIGEAGRPERIEPLDEQGLSQRDRAIITMLSGSTGGGMTINVYGSDGMDIRELAAEVGRELAFQTRRGAI